MLNKEAEKELREANERQYGSIYTFEDDKKEINHIISYLKIENEKEIKELEAKLVSMIINVR